MIGHARLGVAGYQPEVDSGRGVAGQNVVLVAGIEDRERGGGTDRRFGRAALLEFAQQQGLEQPEIGKHDPVEAAHFRRQRSEHFRNRAANLHRQAMVLQPRQSGAHHADRGIARGHRGMAGGRVCRQDQRGIALLGDADQRCGLVEAFHDAVGDQEAFIEHEVEPDAT